MLEKYKVDEGCRAQRQRARTKSIYVKKGVGTQGVYCIDSDHNTPIAKSYIIDQMVGAARCVLTGRGIASRR